MKKPQRTSNIRKIKESENYLCSFEGESQEKIYFERLEKLINESSEAKKRVKFKPASTSHGGDPYEVAKKLLASNVFHDKNKMAAVFDYDGKDTKFKDALELCEKEGVYPAYSNFSFELWLLLHKVDCASCVTNSSDYISKIKRAYGLLPDENIKDERVMQKIVEQITLQDINDAIERAKRLEQRAQESGEILCSINGTVHYRQPYIMIHKFIEDVLENVGL